jgi:hypothetical protein
MLETMSESPTRRILLRMRSNLPHVAPWVLHHRPSVAIRLIGGKLKCFCSRYDCSLISLFYIFHVDVKKRGRGLPKTITVVDHGPRAHISRFPRHKGVFINTAPPLAPF